MVGNAVPPRLAYYIALSIEKCFSALLPFAKDHCLLLVGYVKSDEDFTIIKNKGIYYIRGGNRPGAVQYNQLCKPIKWLLLHHNKRIELFELVKGNAERCSRDDLLRIGFRPRGEEYWLFSIHSEIKDSTLISTILFNF